MAKVVQGLQDRKNVSCPIYGRFRNTAHFLIAPGTKTWVLRSVLPTQLLASMSHPRPLPAFNAAARPVNQDGPQDSGALLNWEKGDGAGSGHIALLGIRTIILSLVMVMGRVIEDGKSATSSGMKGADHVSQKTCTCS